MALTATLDDTSKNELMWDYLISPVVISSTVNHPNIHVRSKEYIKSQGGVSTFNESVQEEKSDEDKDEGETPVGTEW